MKFFSELNQNLIKAYKRFPIAVLWAVCGSFYCMAMGPEQVFDHGRNAVLTIILGISWLLAVRFLAESFKNTKKYFWIDGLMLALLVLYFICLPAYKEKGEAIVYIRWALLLMAGHVFLFFAPFLQNGSHSAYWNYLRHIIIAIGRSILFSSILYMGLVLAIFAIETLLKVNIDSQIYFQLFIFCLGIVNTCMYIADFPAKIQEDTTIHYTKALEVFLQFILMPLLLLYLVILYVYGFEILIQWELPQGWVSYLITILAIVGFIVQIIVNPVKESHRYFLFRKFYPWFYILLLPLMILLFVAVFRRIHDYNFTENRYLLLLLSLWLLSMITYLFFSRKKHLRVLPMSLWGLIIFASFGPLSAFQVSKRAQVKEFKKLYAMITPTTKSLPVATVQRMRGIASYLSERDEIKDLYPVVGFHTTKRLDAYNLVGDVLDSLHIETDFSKPKKHYANGNVDDNTFFNYEQGGSANDINISGYSDFSNLQLSGADSTVDLSFWNDGDSFRIARKGLLVLAFSIDSAARKLADKYGADLYNANPKELTFKFENKVGSFKVVFAQLSFTLYKNKPKISDAAIYLFSTLK